MFADAIRYGERFRTVLREIGETNAGISRAAKSLRELKETGLGDLSAEARTAALSFDGIASAATAAREQIRLLAAEAARVHVPRMAVDGEEGSGGGGGASGGRKAKKTPLWQRDLPGYHAPGIATFVGGTLAYETAKDSFEAYAQTQQVYDQMLSDKRIRTDPAVMRAIQSSAQSNLSKYRTLTPLDAAKNAAEGYAMSGGETAEQSAITDLLGKIEENMILRGKSGADAQQQAKSIVSGMDIGNRFYNQKTGQLDLTRMYREADTMQALIDVGGGFTTGRSIREFFKSSGTVGQDLSAEGLGRAAHFIEVNPQRAAQAIRSFVSLFQGSANRMEKKNKAWWQAQGLYGKDGKLSREAETMLHTDTIGFIEKYMARFSRHEIEDHTQRMNVSSMLDETKGAQGNINRQAAAVARTDANANHDALANSPIGSIKILDASIGRFTTTLGKFEAGPGVRIINQLTDGLDHMSAYMNAHPGDVTKFVGGIESMISAFISVTKLIGSINAHLPDWAKPMIAGAVVGGGAASVVPGVGTAAGAVLGATGMGIKELWDHSGRTLQEAATPSTVPTTAAPMQASRQGQGTQTIHVSLNLDGKKIHEHLQKIDYANAMQDLRSGGAHQDLGTSRMPGLAFQN